jgi:hypothetical protein
VASFEPIWSGSNPSIIRAAGAAVGIEVEREEATAAKNRTAEVDAV